MAVRPGHKAVELVCPVCGETYLKEAAEHKRNQRLGRVSVCGRTCHATFMNLSPAKQAQTKAMLAERNANQYRADNPNWKAGISEGMGHPLEPLPADDPRAAKDPEAREVYRERGRRKAKKARDAERRRKLRALGFKLPDDRRGRSGQ